MAKILIVYSTIDGQTRKICQRLKQLVEERNNGVELVSIDVASQVNLESFDKIVLGASIRYGKHRAEVYEFVRENREILESRPSAFFSVNVVARKPDKNRPETNPYVRKFLAQIAWRPRERAVFAGKIDYQLYRFWDRQIIRFIMWMTRGPTDPRTVAEYTDWKQVEAFGRLICEM